MKVKDEMKGRTGRCPFCKEAVVVQDSVDVQLKKPTKKQLEFAAKVGVEVPVDIDRNELSKRIGEATSRKWPTDKQVAFLESLGLKAPEGITRKEMSELLDQAIEIRDAVAPKIQKEFEEQMAECGMLIDTATELQLLHELDNRGRHFVALVLDNDEFRYDANAVVTGRLTWNDSLMEEDAKYFLKALVDNWVKGFNEQEYLINEYDGRGLQFEINFEPLSLIDER
jgi:sRNA-binding carbon storage regulator CsrA